MYRITVRNESGRRTRFSTLRHALQALFAHYGAPPCAVDVLVAGDDRLRELNHEFRGIDEPTDVLTFPGPDWKGAPLGDIAVSIDFATRGARARRVPVHEELAYLAVHGGLHLLGFEDDTEPGRAGMVVRMNEIALRAGLRPDPDWASQPHTGATGARGHA